MGLRGTKCCGADSPSSLHFFAGKLGRDSVLDGVPSRCVPGTCSWPAGSFAPIAEPTEGNHSGRATQVITTGLHKSL